MIGVIDTSALIRLFIPDGPVPDGLESFFRGVERGRNQAIAPELLVAETANVVLKKVGCGDFTSKEGVELLTDMLAMPIRLFRHTPLIQRAFDLAVSNQLTVYDGLFLALAVAHGAILFSGDHDLLQAADVMQLRLT